MLMPPGLVKVLLGLWMYLSPPPLYSALQVLPRKLLQQHSSVTFNRRGVLRYLNIPVRESSNVSMAAMQNQTLKPCRAMRSIVIFVFVLFTSCHGKALRQGVAKPDLDLLTDAFWDYVAKATLTAEDTLKMIRQSELGQEVNSRISKSSDAINQYTVAVRGQVTPLTQELLDKLSQEAEQLKVRLEQDLSSLKSQLEPYAEELRMEVQKQVEQLKQNVAPYSEALDAHTLRATLLQKSEELRGSLEKSVKQLESQLGPHTEELKEKMDQHLQDFQKNMAPLAQSIQAQLVQRGQEVERSMVPLAEELKTKLDPYAKDLKTQLTSLWESFTKTQQ
ncbi:apolipoprotein A-IV-like [Chanos chanos]|uniref:Apolipoprotein A-IV n=1 Tax=Chanos chanos TaxID=29144 RepID=A0A6J2WMC3_CHACN|nr:apolipoprotein A-IV-like [Chanos chanos]